MLNAVDSINTFQNIFQRIVHRIFSRFDCQTLMTHILQSNDLIPDLFLGQLDSRNMFVFVMIRAISTSIHTIVRKIKRCKHDNTVTIKFLLDLHRKLPDLTIDLRIITLHQDCRLLVADSLCLFCLFQDFLHQRNIVLIFFCIIKRLQDLLMVNKLLCLQ